MANLQKIVKVTQSQYNTLASGGTVGSYTGLNDNYVYLIEDTNTYITSNGGTIDGGNIDFYNGYGIAEVDDNGDVFAGFCIDYYAGEIIYNSHSNYKPLFTDDIYPLIYSDNSDYWLDFTFNTKELRIHDDVDTGGLLVFNAEDGTISRNNQYSYSLPGASGTLALTSQIPTVNNATLTITQNSTSIGTFTANASSNVTIDVVTPKVYRYI